MLKDLSDFVSPIVVGLSFIICKENNLILLTINHPLMTITSLEIIFIEIFLAFS